MAVYSCKHCDKVYSIYASYYSHIETKHKPPKIPCPVCQLKFHTHTQIHAHAFKAHSKVTSDRSDKPAPQVTAKPRENVLSQMLAFQ
jgi:uncharacterized C2H2 Zn-finger protein